MPTRLKPSLAREVALRQWRALASVSIDSYRVPVPVNVSRAVSCGGIVHLCGQLHMGGAGNAEDPCDIVAQIEGAMRRLY